ncbi:MAG TPA: hypothetical protein VML19_03805 [Verrucomicrobiae bacterium]|nr:hypothetical protein [Verrucomicrobiae bacterium]
MKVGNANHDFEPVSAGPLSISVERIHQTTIDFFKKMLSPAGSNQ